MNQQTELKFKKLSQHLGKNDVALQYDDRLGLWTLRRLTVEGGSLGTGTTIQEALEKALHRTAGENRPHRINAPALSQPQATYETRDDCVR